MTVQAIALSHRTDIKHVLRLEDRMRITACREQRPEPCLFLVDFP